MLRCKFCLSKVEVYNDLDKTSIHHSQYELLCLSPVDVAFECDWFAALTMKRIYTARS